MIKEQVRKNIIYLERRLKRRKSLKAKSILVKSIAVTALSVSGLVAINNMNSQTAHAAVVQNDSSVFTAQSATTVYNNYENPVATGQTLPSNSDWKIIKTAYDSKGQKWYDLGKNQWVKANEVVKHVKHTQPQAQPTQNTQSTQTSSAVTASQKQTYSAPQTTQKSSSTYTSSASGSEASAKEWIASQESGGSYGSRNGQYIGKYQLSASYLGGDYSAANQERAADNYVKSRYGSWSAAKSFWQSNGYY